MRFHRLVFYGMTSIVAGIYLFIQAPPPIVEPAAPTGEVPIEVVFEVANTIKASAREIYTGRIVGPGKKAGLAFDEDWREEDVYAGPLPALFLRTTARHLERDPIPLGLFLGSDAPINPSNHFSPEQLQLFASVRQDRAAQFGQAAQRHFGMFPDLASAQPCVTCHNDHADSPRTDWQLGDVMGATTWTHPEPAVSTDELLMTISAVYSAIALAYDDYIDEVLDGEEPPVVGSAWPESGYMIPDTQTFMAAVRSSSSPAVLVLLLGIPLHEDPRVLSQAL